MTVYFSSVLLTNNVVLCDLFLAVFQVDASPEVIPQITKTCEGEPVEIVCRYSLKDGIASWFSRTVTGWIITYNGSLLDGLDRNKYGVDGNASCLILKIYNASIADNGYFTCRQPDHTLHSTAVVIVGEFLF